MISCTIPVFLFSAWFNLTCYHPPGYVTPEEWLETNYLSKLKYVFEGMFQNSKRMWV